MTPEPRWILSANYDTKVLYERMLWDEHAGGMLSREDFDRRGLLFAYGIVRHVNGKTGIAGVGISKLAQDLGYDSENHGFHKARKVLLNLGFLTCRGKVGRASKLSMSVPEALRDKTDKQGNQIYATLFDSVTGDLVTVTDTSKLDGEARAKPIPESKSDVATTATGQPEPGWWYTEPEGDDEPLAPPPLVTVRPPRRSPRFNATV
ncbi:hypothetical protein [Streptosporangium pseudovulgare]|uniref:Uncharacterized protein n=1 Tax=Streptosporangium pseudovulgare TaxID=35765 RepID=A0ABQ2QLV0_9ACTN|nr:hypothetical protein [Streptosporangium pseudovulgare]GGP84492.1 hypothetical protein GCM10010140_12000 [Streptosporangium pseudovulgare]